LCGDREAVPALAKLLTDAELASWARIALEAIPDPAADAALRNALDKTQGRLSIGVINSLGVRRDAKAVDLLIERLRDTDVEVASAAAVSLGRIGGNSAGEALLRTLADQNVAVRTAAAEGCVLCAEGMAAKGEAASAVKYYRAVLEAKVPEPAILPAIRGLILVQGTTGLPLLAELLESPDKHRFSLGLGITREMSGQDITKLLVEKLNKTPAARRELLLLALADRGDKSALPAVIAAIESGEAAARCAALQGALRLGDANCVPALLNAALDENADVAQTAMAVLADLPGKEVDRALAERLSGQPSEKMQLILIQLAGRREIASLAPTLLQATEHPNAEIRTAALVALGATVELKDLPLLIERTANPASGKADKALEKTLLAACQRMPDREACAATLIEAFQRAPAEGKCRILEILRGLGGQKALDAVAAAAKDSDPQIQETAGRLLGDWPDVAAASALMDLAKNAESEKYRVRALRGYIRLARQFSMPDADRVAMCRAALAQAQRFAERKLVLEVMGRYPSPEMLKLAIDAAKEGQLKTEAVAVAVLIARKTGVKSDELDRLVASVGQKFAKIEIVKAEYGSGTNVKDVTTILRKHVYDFPVIILPSPSYNGTFGGDPAQGKSKQLKVEYRMDGKANSASFDEDETIVLPPTP
jgi:HEAT repeat protein